MKNKILVTLLIIGLLVSCAPRPTSTPTETIPDDIPGANDKKALLDFALSPDGTQVAIYTNQDVYIYDIATHDKNIIKKFSTDDFAKVGAGAVAFSPNGKLVAIAGRFPDQPIQVWDIDSHELAGEIINIPNGYYVSDIEFSLDGKRLVAISTYESAAQCQGPENRLVLYDISNIDTLEHWRDTDIYNLDGCSVAPIVFRFTSNNKLYVYLYPDLNIIDSITGEIDKIERDSVFQDISANGQVIASYDSQTENYTVWTVGKENSRLAVVQNEVILLNNEKHFLERSDDQNMKYWKNGKPKCEYGKIELFNFDISRDGNVFGTKPSTRNELQLWNVPECALTETLIFDE